MADGVVDVREEVEVDEEQRQPRRSRRRRNRLLQPVPSSARLASPVSVSWWARCSMCASAILRALMSLDEAEHEGRRVVDGDRLEVPAIDGGPIAQGRSVGRFPASPFRRARRIGSLSAASRGC